MPVITLIGAGSGCFSLSMARALCASESLAGSEVRLMDINKERLDSVHGLCERLAAETADAGGGAGAPRFSKTLDRAEALDGADAVVNTALAAPHRRLKEGWAIAQRHGFRFPGSYHIMYDEAFWVNFYQFRLFESLTRDMARLCPEAWHLMVANPVFAGTTLIHRNFPGARMVGLCHGFTSAIAIGEALGCPRGKGTFQIPGPNHFVWLNKGHLGDQEFFSVLAKREEKPFSKIHADFLRRHGVVGIGDTLSWTGACWPWWYHSDAEAMERFGAGDPWVGWNGYFDGVEKSAADIIALAGQPERSARELAGSERDEWVVPLVESLVLNVPRVMTVNTLNARNAVPGLPGDIAVEVQALCRKDGVFPIPVDPLPRGVLAHIWRDRLAPVEMELEAYRTGRMCLLEELVLMDKWAVSLRQARAFIDEILALPYHAEMREHYRD